ncbi:MAG: hypothetical protein IPP66_22775 [Anaerolineales bacterium]|nr:hypothetical protein [Anaerolineales bacterium]
MKQNDDLDKMKEWQDHQYNPGYWVNKFSPGFPPKRSKGFWLFSLIDVFVFVPVFIFSLFVYFIEGNSGYLYLVGIFGAFSILAILRARRFKPLPKTKNQIEIEELRREKKEEKKKRPKRRKDYN